MVLKLTSSSRCRNKAQATRVNSQLNSKLLLGQLVRILTLITEDCCLQCLPCWYKAIRFYLIELKKMTSEYSKVIRRLGHPRNLKDKRIKNSIFYRLYALVDAFPYIHFVFSKSKYLVYSAARGTVNTQTVFWHFYDIFLTSLMLGNWQLANQGESCKAE